MGRTGSLSRRATQVTHALAVETVARFEKAAQKAAGSGAWKGLSTKLARIVESKANRRALAKSLSPRIAEKLLPSTASLDSAAGGTRNHYETMLVLAEGLGLHGNAARYRQLLGTLDRLLASGSPEVRAIAANFDPAFLNTARSILGGGHSIRYLERDKFNGLLHYLAGLCGEADLVGNSQFLTQLQEVMQEVATGKRLPKTLAGAALDLDPLVVRRVRAPDLSGRSNQQYVDILVLFRGHRALPDGSTQLLYYAPLRAQSKLGDAAKQLFTRLEDEVEVMGQLRSDDLRWGTGAIGLNGARIPPDQIFDRTGGQRVLAAATRPFTDAELASAAAEGIRVVPIRHTHAAGRYYETARLIMAAFGVRKRGS